MKKKLGSRQRHARIFATLREAAQVPPMVQAMAQASARAEKK